MFIPVNKRKRKTKEKDKKVKEVMRRGFRYHFA